MDEEKKKIAEQLLGKWYEQCGNGAVLTVEERTLIYEKYGEKKLQIPGSQRLKEYRLQLRLWERTDGEHLSRLKTGKG